MYIARFSYSLLLLNPQRAIAFINREIEAAVFVPFKARLLIPRTRGQYGAAQ
jgi:hypothetical protein